MQINWITEKWSTVQNWKLNIMTQSSISIPYAQRLAEKFRESKAYLRANGLSRSTKTLYEDIETSTDK